MLIMQGINQKPINVSPDATPADPSKGTRPPHSVITLQARTNQETRRRDSQPLDSVCASGVC